MTPGTIYPLLIEAMEANLPTGWTIARLQVQFVSNGSEAEFSGTYLDANGTVQPLSTDFPDEVAEAVPQLYAHRHRMGLSRANTLQLDLTAAGHYTTAYHWEQELEDEEAHFGHGGTAREWQAIRLAKYGPLPDADLN